MINKPVFTTDKKKISYFKYIFTHCLPTGFFNFKLAISLWVKLIQGDYSDYQLYNSRISKYSDNELFEMIRADFWGAMEDDVLDKEFLEYLIQLKEEVNLGNLETVPWDFDKFLYEIYAESEE